MTTSSPDLNVVIPHVSCLVRENSRLMPLEDPRPSCSVNQSISLPLRPVTGNSQYLFNEVYTRI